MNFIEAITLAMKGKKITRATWRGINYVYWDHKLGYLCKDVDLVPYYVAFIISDVLTEDWEIYKENPQIYTFNKAFEAYSEGKSIKRMEWEYSITKDISHISTGLPDKPLFSYTDIIKNDWLIGEE